MRRLRRAWPISLRRGVVSTGVRAGCPTGGTPSPPAGWQLAPSTPQPGCDRPPGSRSLEQGNAPPFGHVSIAVEPTSSTTFGSTTAIDTVGTAGAARVTALRATPSSLATTRRGIRVRRIPTPQAPAGPTAGTLAPVDDGGLSPHFTDCAKIGAGRTRRRSSPYSRTTMSDRFRTVTETVGGQRPGRDIFFSSPNRKRRANVSTRSPTIATLPGNLAYAASGVENRNDRLKRPPGSRLWRGHGRLRLYRDGTTDTFLPPRWSTTSHHIGTVRRKTTSSIAMTRWADRSRRTSGQTGRAASTTPSTPFAVRAHGTALTHTWITLGLDGVVTDATRHVLRVPERASPTSPGLVLRPTRAVTKAGKIFMGCWPAKRWRRQRHRMYLGASTSTPSCHVGGKGA